MKRLRLLAVTSAVVLSLPLSAGAARERAVGTYLNHLTACLDGELRPSPPAEPTVLAFSCTGGSVYFGTLTGHTHILFDGTYDIATGEIRITFDEWLFARHLGDGSQGALHYRGQVEANARTLEFTGTAKVVDAACDFEGARGNWSFDGTLPVGSYVLEWTRHKVPASDPACLATTAASVIADRVLPS